MNTRCPQLLIPHDKRPTADAIRPLLCSIGSEIWHLGANQPLYLRIRRLQDACHDLDHLILVEKVWPQLDIRPEGISAGFRIDPSPWHFLPESKP